MENPVGRLTEALSRSREGRREERLADDERRAARSDARVAHRLATELSSQWSAARLERRNAAAATDIAAGPSNFTRAQVPWGFDLAAAWSWRILVIAAAGYIVLRLLALFSVIVVPLVVALFVAALAAPVVAVIRRTGLPRGLAALVTVVAGLAFVVLLVTFASQQVANGFSDLSLQVADGLQQVRQWLRTGPLQLSNNQLSDLLKQGQQALTSNNEAIVTRATEVGTTVGHVLAGVFITLFASYFFLADGHLIWAWIVRLFPRAARAQVDSSGRVAWSSTVQFVRATVLVALVDALGIGVGAFVLGVPLSFAIGILVFVGAFIPLVGATLSGSVAILVALVAHGPVVALLMLAVVIGVQQLEAHILQPFLLGRFVSVHPLAVIVAIGCGVLVAGIVGALVAVPLVAAVNSVGQHLAEGTKVGDSVEDAVARDPGSPPPYVDPDEAPEVGPDGEVDAGHDPERPSSPDTHGGDADR